MGCRKLQFEEQFFFVKDNKSKNKGFSFCGNLDSKTSENNTSFGDLQKAFSFVKPVETPLKKLPVNTHECVKQKKRYKSVFYDEQVGKNLFSANVTNPSATDMLYSGEQFDPNLQMQYLRARYYDQSNGTFNSLDPFNGNMGDPQSLHKYGYCHGNPVMGIDPSGNMSLINILGATFISSTMRTIKATQSALTKTRLLRAMWKVYEYGSLVIGLTEIGLKLSMGIPLEWSDWVSAFGAVSYFKVFVPLVGFMKARLLKNLASIASRVLPKARLQMEFTKWFKMPIKALNSFDSLFEWVHRNKHIIGIKAIVFETTRGPGRALGSYNPSTKIIRLYKGGHNIKTLIHELAHHLNFTKHFKGNEALWTKNKLYVEAFAEVIEAMF